MPPPALPCREEEMPELALWGMGGLFSYEQIPQIAALWQRFHRRFPNPRSSYGVTLNHSEDATQFRYFAAFRAAGDDLPEGLESINIPAQRYKVFRYQGTAQSILQAFNYIWGVWLPDQADWQVSGIDFEYYPPEYDPESESSWVDIYIPIVKKHAGSHRQ